MNSFLRYSLLIGKLLTISILSMAQISIDNTVDQHISCPSGNDGQITVSVSGMVAGNYYVQWQNLDDGTSDFRVITLPKTTVVFPDEGYDSVNITSGSHTVTVIKAMAPIHFASKSVSVKEPDALSYTVSQPTCAVNTGTIEIDSPIDDKGVYSFEYSVDGGTTYQVSPLFEGLSDADYDISVKITSHTDCFLTDVVTINPAPTAPATPEADVTQPTCAVATGTIEVTLPVGAEYEYSNNFEATWQDGTTFSNLVPDTYLVTARSKIDNTCKSNKIFTINAQPTPPAAPTATTTDATCAGGGTVEVTSPLGAGYEYSIDGANYQASTTFSDVASGDYDVTVRLVADPLCISAPTAVTVNAAAGVPVIDNTSHTDPTTLGGSEGTITVNLVAGSGTPDYVYYLTDNLSNPVANSPATAAETYEFTGLSAGNYTVYVIDNASCTSASVTGIILEDPVGCTDAEITLTSANDNQTVCQDESIADIVYSIAGDFGAVNVAGLPNGVSGSLVGATYTISGTPTEFGTFNYTVTVDGSGGCLGDNASGTINVTEPTVPTFDQLGPYCLSDAADALPGTSTNGITGSWSPATISTATSGTTVYNFTPDAGQCATTTSMSVNVNEAPQNVDAGPDVSICEGESTQLQGSVDLPINNNVLFNEDFSSVASGGLPAGWARNSSLWGGMNTNLAGGSAPEMAIFTDGSTDIQTYRVYTPLINAADNQFLELSFKHELIHYNGAYTVEVQTSPDGVNWTSCWSEVSSGTEGSHILAQTVSIDLSTLDGESFYVAFTYTGALFNIDYWNFDDVKLTGLQSDPVDILWTPSTGLSDPTILKPIASPLVTTTYTLTVGIGGCENSDQVTVTVKEIVAPVFSLNPTYEYCIGDSPVILPLVSDNGIEGTWDPSTISTDVSGLTTYTFTPNPGECATPTSIDVQVFDLPTAHMSGGGEYCEGADPTGVDVQIDFTGVAPWTYTFAVSGDVRTFTSSDNPKIFDNRGEGYFELLSVQDANCTGTVSGDALVVEIPAPTATISGGGVYCEGVLATGVDVSIDLTGTGPWDIIYAIDGTDQPTVTGVTSSPYVIANATAGVYTLTSVNDSSPCLGTVSGSATVTELESPTATISGGGGYCAGTTPTGVDVTITLTGNAPWDVVYAIDGANQAAVTGITSSPYVITNAAVGEYTLTSVGDINGCDGTVSGSATVTEWELPTATISGGGGYCAGVDPTGVNVNIELTGVGPWNIVYAIDGVSQPTVTGVNSSPYVITNATEGVYTLISVGDSSPCPGTVSGSATVIEFELPTATISGGGDYCAGANPTGVDVTITLTGNGPWNIVYAIDGADQLAVTANSSPYTLSNVTAGEYTLTSVDDINGCIGTVSGLATVVERELPTATMSGGGSYCKGADPTGVDVRIDFTGEAPWTYTFAVGGEERTFIATETPRIFENRGEGHFTIISVEDAYCTGTVSGEAFVYEIVTAAPTGDSPQEFCAGATLADIVVTGAAIAWYDAPDGNMLNMTDVLVDGVTYYATQTAEGCESTDYLAVTVNVWDELSISVMDVNHGRCDIPNAGSIEVQGAGGAFPYTYTLFDETDSQIDEMVSDNIDPVLFTGLATGKYYVVFDDFSSCDPKTTVLIEILEANPVTIDDVLITNSNCFGDDNATIEVTASGGDTNLYFSLLDNLDVPIIGPQTNDGVLLGISDGEYTILVTSDNGCEARLAIEVSGPDNLSIQTDIINIPCSYSGDEGVIRAMPLGGTAPYTVSFYLGGVLEEQVTGVGYNSWVEFDQLPVGTNYEVVVDDRWGCGPVSSGALEITLPSALVVGAPIVQDVLCNGDATGQVTITASGGTAPYTFTLLDNSNNAIATSTNGVFENVAFGNNYSISVVDDNACNQVLSSLFDINEPDPIVIDINSILVNSISCYGAANGEVSISASGGTGDLYYTLTNAGLTIGGPQLGNGAFTGLSSGGYIIEVTDDRNCGPVLSDVIDIDEPEQLIVQVIVNNPLCNDNIGSINVLASKGTSPYTYELYTGVTLTETITGVTDEEVVFNNLASATYFVKITDANGCTLFTDNESIEVAPEKLLLTLNSTDPILNNDGTTTNGTITAVVSGGTALYHYFLFKLGETVALDNNYSGIFSIVERGAYQVKVIDANGCEVIGDIALSQYTFTLSATDVLCFGSCDGTITVTEIDGSSALQERKWLKDEEDVSEEMEAKYSVADGRYNGVCAGSYTLTATANGSEHTEKVEISEPNSMTITSFDIYQRNKCFGDNKGEISILVEGNTETLEYRIEGPLDANYEFTNNHGIFNQLPAGSYKLYVTDNNGSGCTQIFPEEGVYKITQPDEILISTVTDITQRLCHNDTIGMGDDGIIMMKVDGGTPDYTYSWDNGQQTLDLEYPTPGMYTLTVTDESQCVGVKEVVIPGPLKPNFDNFITVNQANCRIIATGNKNTGSIKISGVETGTGNGQLSEYAIDWYYGIDKDSLVKSTDIPGSIEELNAGTYVAHIGYPKMGAEGTCFIEQEFDVNVVPENAFSVSINGGGAEYCFQDTVELTMKIANGIKAKNITWYNFTDDTLREYGNKNLPYYIEGLDGAKTIHLIVTSEANCVETSRTAVNLYPRIYPFIDRTTHPFFVESDLNTFRKDPEDLSSPGDSMVVSLLMDTEYPIEILTKNPNYEVKYSWTPVTCFTPNDDKQATMMFRADQYESLPKGTVINTFTKKPVEYIPIQAIVMSQEYGCIETVNLKARILDKIKNSNVFSPNGDGINDRWKIPYSDVIPNLEIKIFNRWGANVWSAKGSEAIKGWDGKNSRGKDLSIGTYYYVISFNVVGTNKWKPISGSVTIIR